MSVIQPAQTSSPRRCWLFVAAVAATVILASSRSHVETPDNIPNVDKLAHFSVYGLGATLVLRALGAQRWLWALAAVSFFGVTDELHQFFVPGRSCDVRDWLADTMGGLLAITLYLRWSFYRRCLEGAIAPMRSRLQQPVATIRGNVSDSAPHSL